MFKARKFKRNAYIVLAVIIVGYIVFFHVFNQQENYEENKYKISIIEESIRSNVNHGECKIPNLPVDNPEIMKFYSKAPPLKCSDSNDDWVVCEKSICDVKPIIRKQKGPIQCSYTDLIRKSDSKVKYGKTTHTKGSYTLQQSDFAKVYCKTDSGVRWYGIAIGIRDTVKQRQYKKQDSISPQISVLIMGLDSLSKNAFIRKLPKTYKYLMQELKSHVLNGYNIVGDGTPQALIPILTGQTELELPETRRRMKGSNYVNVYPLIWKDYENVGYYTAFNEDLPETGTFTYRLNGFDEQPTDHYMRTFYVEVANYLSVYPKFCIGHQPSHQVMLNYTKNFMLKYFDKPRFVFSFHGELSHDSINLIEVADEDVRNWLMDLKQSGILDNTILIMMSDHGNRFAEVRNTLQGKQEERLPFFSFTFPQIFKEKYPQKYQNFLDNVNLLTTPFDIHETLMDILYIQSLVPLTQQKQQQKQESRAISLFNVIPKNRSCAEAYIEPHWCVCLNWSPVNDTESILVKNIVQTVIDKINAYTKPSRNLCEVLQLKDINWVMHLTPNSNLLKFKKNFDRDGFLADLTSDTKLNTEMYQIKITVLPGNSIFEASVTHNLKDHKFSVNLADISRINKYGSQANCIYERNPELRKFCYCKI